MSGVKMLPHFSTRNYSVALQQFIRRYLTAHHKITLHIILKHILFYYKIIYLCLHVNHKTFIRMFYVICINKHFFARKFCTRLSGGSSEQVLAGFRHVAICLLPCALGVYKLIIDIKYAFVLSRQRLFWWTEYFFWTTYFDCIIHMKYNEIIFERVHYHAI